MVTANQSIPWSRGTSEGRRNEEIDLIDRKDSPLVSYNTHTCTCQQVLVQSASIGAGNTRLVFPNGPGKLHLA